MGSGARQVLNPEPPNAAGARPRARGARVCHGAYVQLA